MIGPKCSSQVIVDSLEVPSEWELWDAEYRREVEQQRREWANYLANHARINRNDRMSGETTV